MNQNTSHSPISAPSLQPSDEVTVRGRLLLAMGLLFVSALPDAMVVPVLHELMVERYGVDATGQSSETDSNGDAQHETRRRGTHASTFGFRWTVVRDHVEQECIYHQVGSAFDETHGQRGEKTDRERHRDE